MAAVDGEAIAKTLLEKAAEQGCFPLGVVFGAALAGVYSHFASRQYAKIVEDGRKRDNELVSVLHDKMSIKDERIERLHDKLEGRSC